jgi:hypothetical protein
VTTGTVFVGNARTKGSYGILSSGTVVDVPLGPGVSSVVAQGQAADLLVENGSMTLASNPILGIPPVGIGFGKCAIKQDLVGALLIGGTLSLANATIQCQSTGGIGVLGPATVTLDSSLIRNCDIGLAVGSGAVSVTNSLIVYSVIGAEQLMGGSIDLSGGGNTVVCSSTVEDSSQSWSTVGIDVFNAGPNSLNASNVAWDTTGPDSFACSSDLSVCACSLSSCTTGPGSNDMDAVTIDGGGSITTTGNTQSPLAVDAGCG